MPLVRQIIMTVRVHDGVRTREGLVGLVMIDDDHLGARRVGGIDRRAGHRATIKGEDQPRAVLGETAQHFCARAISLGQPVGNVGQGLLVMGAEIALDQSDGGRAVDVVVAEGGNLLPSDNRVPEARGSTLHVLEARRVWQERAERWIEIAGDSGDLGAARGKHAPQQLGERVGLGDRCGDESPRGIEPLDPAIAPRRALDAEERRTRYALNFRIFQGCRHDRRLRSACPKTQV